MILRRALAVACLCGLIGLACRDGQHDEASDGFETSLDCVDRPVRVAVASSLRELALSLRRHLASQQPSIGLELIFGASSAHARQLSQGAPIDIFVSADARIIDDLVGREFLIEGSRLEFAHGQLSLVAHPNWSPRLSASSALESDELQRLAVPSAAVPLGRYARAWLASRGLLERLSGKIVVTEHARATLAAVDAGLVDLAIVYRSELRLAKRASELAAIDPSEHPAIRYVAARTTSAPDCSGINDAIAAWGQPFLQSELASAGFLLVDPMSALQ
jgi:molybdate transport system substrate-binding protein